MTTAVVLGTGWKDQIDGGIERRHLYDGWTPEQTVAPLLDAIDGGVETVILTNAAGALNRTLEVGEVVCITDHLNLTGRSLDMFGHLPCVGIYQQIPGYRTGVYAQLHGPLFETPAEARMIAALGADLAGMSTALEAVAAHAHGCRVVGLSLVTNYSGRHCTHDDVQRAADRVDLQAVLADVLGKL